MVAYRLVLLLVVCWLAVAQLPGVEGEEDQVVLLPIGATDSQVGYAVYLPIGYNDPVNRNRLWPVLVTLGGAGEASGNGDMPALVRVTRHGVTAMAEGRKSSHGAWDWPAIGICPQVQGWVQNRASITETVRSATKRLRADLSRVYVSGLCSGGEGSYHMAIQDPELVAAIVPCLTTGGAVTGFEALLDVSVWGFANWNDKTGRRTHTDTWADNIATLKMGSQQKILSSYDYQTTIIPSFPRLAGDDYVWFSNDRPSGASRGGIRGSFHRVTSYTIGGVNVTPQTGSHMHVIPPQSGEHGGTFGLGSRSDVFASFNGESFFADVYIDPIDVPTAIAFSFQGDRYHHPRTNVHAFWSAPADQGVVGLGSTSTRFYLGDLPPTGVWTRLEVPMSTLGLPDGMAISKWEFRLYDGAMAIDKGGLTRAVEMTTIPTISPYNQDVGHANETRTVTLSANGETWRTEPSDSDYLPMPVSTNFEPEYHVTYYNHFDHISSWTNPWNNFNVWSWVFAQSKQRVRPYASSVVNYSSQFTNHVVYHRPELPGTVIPAHFDQGANGYAFAETSAAAPQSVGDTLTNIDAGEWTGYSVSVLNSGSYSVALLMSGVGTAVITVEGGSSYQVNVNSTALDYVTISGIEFSAGYQRFTVGATTGSLTLAGMTWQNDDIVIDNRDVTRVTMLGQVWTIPSDSGGRKVLSAGTSWLHGQSAWGYLGEDYLYAYDAASPLEVRYTPEIITSGAYEVSIRYAAWTAFASNVPVTVNHSDGSDLSYVDMRTGGGVWHSLGTFNFDAGTSQNIMISTAGTDGLVVADAIKLTPIAAAPVALPGVVEAEDFNNGLPGLAWKDVDGPVDLAMSGMEVIDFTVGEYLNYNVSAATSMLVTIDVAAAADQPAVLRIHTPLGSRDIDIAATGGFDFYTTSGLTAVGIPQGVSTVRLEVIAGTIAIDYLQFNCQAVIIDNLDVPAEDRTGAWFDSSSFPGYYASNYAWAWVNDGNTDTMAFNAAVPETGYYDVGIQYAANANRSSSVPVTIIHDHGTFHTTVDMTVGGYGFESLGKFVFSADGNGQVIIGTDGTSGFVIADAIKFEKQRVDLIVDNYEHPGQVEMTPGWLLANSVPGFYLGNYHFRWANGSVETFGFRPAIPVAQAYDAFIWYCASPSRHNAIPVLINHDGGTTVNPVDMTVNGNQWNPLGTFNFATGTTGSLVVSTDGVPAGKGVVADAIRLVEPRVHGPVIDFIIDNLDLETAKTGPWGTGTFVKGFWSDNYNFIKGDTTATFSFLPNFPVTGNYAVYIHHCTNQWRETAVPIDIHHDGGVTTVIHDMKNSSANAWHPLGTFSFGTSGEVMVRTTGTVGWVIADAVRFVKVPEVADN